MTTFNSITAKPDAVQAVRVNTAGASAGGAAQSGNLQVSNPVPDLDVAQRLARKSIDSVPETNRLLESVANDVSLIESIQQAAGVLSDAASKAPAFDASGVTAALETIEFALQQGREFAERLKSELPSLETIKGLTVEALAANGKSYSTSLQSLGSESDTMRKRLAALAEDIGGRNERIASRAKAVPSAEAVAFAMQSQAKRGLASVSIPVGGQSQVSSLLADIGLERGLPARGSASSGTAAAVSTLVSRLQKQFPDAG